MSWWQALWLALSVALAITVFVVSDDEPFLMRVGNSLLVGCLWLLALLLFALMMLVDGIVALMRWARA